MAKRKIQIEFEGFEQVAARLKELDGDIKGVTERALKKSHAIVTEKAERAIIPHKRTGRTQSSLEKNANVQWDNTIGTVYVGFDISKGGLAHIFLMYGTPRIEPDRKLYNAFWGASTRKQIMKVQEDIFYDEIRRLNG